MTKPIARDPIYRGRRFQTETIELCVRWYITYRLRSVLPCCHPYIRAGDHTLIGHAPTMLAPLTNRGDIAALGVQGY
jgi:hypothetical protein